MTIIISYFIHIARWKSNNENDKILLDCILQEPKLDKQPDVYVDIRIPNEFQTYGKFNIGITAGIETTAVSNVWLEYTHIENSNFEGSNFSGTQFN